jgi:hypothetical protein
MYYLVALRGLKSGNLNHLEPSGPVKACNGIALHLPHVLNPRHTTYLPTYGDGTVCSETLALKLRTQVNNPEESV